VTVGALMSSRRAQIVAVAVGVLLYLLATWFLFVSPKRAEAARLQDEVVAAEARLTEARAQSGRPQGAQSRVSDLFSLAKAMPSSSDQASLLLELDLLARKSGVTIAGISMDEAAPLAGGSTAVPVGVTVGGTYRQITRFVRQMRGLVGLRGGDPYAKGRLLTVQSIELTESQEKGFPNLDAVLVLNAHVYDGPIPLATPVTPPASSGDGTETTSTATAAGATP
jgi:Tfp pilus assembly protein PilO